MFVFSDNEQLKREVKKMIIDSGMTIKDVAAIMEVKPQQYNNIVNKENFSFKDAKRIACACGCDLLVEFKKR